MAENQTFVHHVFFWLNHPGSQEDFNSFAAGLKALSVIKVIRSIHIGKPAGTNREVIDRSYSLSLMLQFNNKADHDSYQTDPVHLKFVENCRHLWKKIVIYDSIDV